MSGNIEVIVGIKLGTNYSTNAYMVKDDTTEDMKSFSIPFNKHATSSLSLVTPTVALFTDYGEFRAFGFDAEYHNFHLGESSNFLLFRDFVWDLLCVSDRVPGYVKAVNGKEMKSVDVVSAVLEYMDSHMRSTLCKHLHIVPIIFKYVLTVPTCSCDDSRVFMKEAAEKAGIPSDNITIVEEAVAALCFCIQNPIPGLPKPLEDQQMSYIFVECEDDNTNVSVLKYLNGEISMIYKDNAEVWASCQVQKDFEELFALLVSESFLDYFIHKYPMEYYDVLQELKKKIQCTPSDNEKVTIKMPAFLMEKFKRKTGKSIAKAVQKTIMKGHMEFKLDKCKLASEVFQSLFSDAAKHIVNYMKEELLPSFPDAEYIILIGEFAQSPILQEIIKTSFPAKRILIPQEANLTAIKGAVCLGQKPVALKTTCCPRRHLTLVPEDTESATNVEQSLSPRAYRATRNDVSNLSATNTSPSKLQRVVSSPEKINRSRLCVIQ